MGKIVKHSEMEKRADLSGQMAPQTPKPIAAVLGQRGGVIRKGELSAQERAQKIIEEAQSEGDRIRAEAAQILSRVREETEKAKSKGYSEGKEEGMAELTETILKARKEKEAFFESAEPEVIKLVMSIAEKVIGKLAEAHKEVVQAIIRKALERSLGDRITVRIHPEDFKRLKSDDLQFRDLLDRTKQLHFKEDEAIQRGGCVVETEIGTIDAQLETQLKAIRKALGI